MNATFLYMARLSIENGNEFMSTRNNCYINPTVQYNCMTSKTILWGAVQTWYLTMLYLEQLFWAIAVGFRIWYFQLGSGASWANLLTEQHRQEGNQCSCPKAINHPCHFKFCRRIYFLFQLLLRLRAVKSRVAGGCIVGRGGILRGGFLEGRSR